MNKSRLGYIIYRLKHKNPVSLDLYKLTDSTVDRATGRKTTTRVKYSIFRAVALPVEKQTLVDVRQTEVLLGDRLILIDLNDLPEDFILDDSDYIIINGDRYDLVKHTEISDANCLYLHTRHIQMTPPGQILETSVDSSINAGETLT